VYVEYDPLFTMTSTATKLNERNYREWVIGAEASLRGQEHWKYATGERRVPRPLIVPSSVTRVTPARATTSASEDSQASDTPTATTSSLIGKDPRDLNYDFMPESDDPGYLSHYYNFLRDWNKWQLNNDKALGGIQGLLEPTMEKQ